MQGIAIGLAFCMLPGLAAATEAKPMNWQNAVAELAGERTKAETCVRLLKRNAKEGQAALDRGEFAYGEAKGEMDAVIAGLLTAIASNDTPASFSTLEVRLRKAITQREAFCADVKELVRADPGAKGIWDTLVGGLIGPVVDLVKQLYTDYRDQDLLTRATIQTQLEATRWPEFATVSS